ncbi:MAG: diacylglycerol kinase family protein [bacterium]
MTIILFNPLSQKGGSIHKLNEFIKKHVKDEYVVKDVTTNKIKDLNLNEEDKLVIIGGDGTLHTITNEIRELELKNEIYLYKGGSGNDFSRDFPEDYFNITKYINHCPKSNGSHYLTSTGFGVDGEICDNVNKNEKANYYKTTINTMKKFKRFNLELIVDGKEYKFTNVWFASVMNGRCIGGGMKLSPKSDRLDDLLEVYVIHKVGLFKLLRIFPTIFLGVHTIFKKNIFTIQGKEITMFSDESQVMHSDGEIYGKVNSINVKF